MSSSEETTTKADFEFLPRYSIRTNIIWTAGVVITTIACFVFLCKVFKKKKSLRNELLNTSYCKISDQILTLLAINLVIYSLFIQVGVTFSWYTTLDCERPENQNCWASRYLGKWNNLIQSSVLLS